MDSSTTNSVNNGGRGSGQFNEMTLIVGETLKNDNEKTVLVFGMTNDQKVRLAYSIEKAFGFIPNTKEAYRSDTQYIDNDVFSMQITKKELVGYVFSYPCNSVNMATNHPQEGRSML